MRARTGCERHVDAAEVEVLLARVAEHERVHDARDDAAL